MPRTDRCRLCGTTKDIEYCSVCQKSFCPSCKKKYPERVEAMMQEKVFDPIGDVLEGLGNLFRP